MNEQERHITVWNGCLRIISQIVEPQQYATWFQPIRSVSLVGSTLTLEVPSEYYREYLESAFIDVLSKVLRRELGAGARLMYKVSPVQNQQAMTFPASEAPAPANRPVSVTTYQLSGNPGAFVFPGLKKVQIPSMLNPSYRFSNFVLGECNRMGVTAGIDISKKPGKTPFNPLFIFGGPGLGKTHLAQAIGNSIKEQYPDLIALYVTGNQFKTQYVNAVNVQNKLTDFMAFYMKVDVLIVDDIQDLVGQGNQNAFFNIFNHLHQNGKQLILTSDRAPKDLVNFEERLLSRFKWGLPVELLHPDYSTRLSMLQSRCEREGVLNVAPEALEYIAMHVRTNFRELEGALISMIAHATYAHKDCTADLAAQVVDKIVTDTQEEITVDRVEKVVSDYFNITVADIVSNSRKRQIVQARQIAMYMCRSLIPNCSLSVIGSEMGGKDHSTVLHACSIVADLMSTDRSFKKYVSDIQRTLQPLEQ